MAKEGKRFVESLKIVDRDHYYSPREAIKLVKQVPGTKFDETVEVALRLGVDPRKPDQQVRGALALPKGTGKTMRVVVFAKGEKATTARETGADVVAVGCPFCMTMMEDGINARKGERDVKVLDVSELLWEACAPARALQENSTT